MKWCLLNSNATLEAGQRGMIFLLRHLSLDKISFCLESQWMTFNCRDQLSTGTTCHRTHSSEGSRGTGGTVQFILRWLADACLPCTWLQMCTLPSRTRSLPRSDGAIQRGDSHPRACCDFLRTLLRWKCDFKGLEKWEAWAWGRYPLHVVPTASVSHCWAKACLARFLGGTGCLSMLPTTKTLGEGLIQKHVFDNDLFHRTKSETTKWNLANLCMQVRHHAWFTFYEIYKN